MRVFYAADMHGSERVWRKFTNAAKYYKADWLILGGDITGKILVPLIEEPAGVFRAEVFGRVEQTSDAHPVDDLEKRLRFNGFYPYRCSPDEYGKLAEDPAYRDEIMNRVMVQEVARWVAIADEKLRGTGVRCLAIAGNDDAFDVDVALNSETVENVEGRVVRMGDYQLLSSAWGNISPWDTPREAEEDRLTEIFDELASHLDPEIPTIFNLHVPPYGSGLDTGPEVAGVDEDGHVIVRTSGGQPQSAPVGSHAVRAIVERVQPLVSFHSHIHESRNVVHIGSTLCINPGSNYTDGVLDGVIVDLKGPKVKRYQLVSG